MQVLSLRQPWATLVVLGIKQIETRSWRPAHRGTLAIHASTRFPPHFRLCCERQPLRALLREAGYDDWTDLALGAILGTVELTECIPVEDLPELSELERFMGDYSPGRWAWLLSAARRLPEPIPCRGRLGVFDLAEQARPQEGTA
jgi:hypothetical protein